MVRTPRPHYPRPPLAAILISVMGAILLPGAPRDAAANTITSLSRGYDSLGGTVVTVTLAEPVSRELVRSFMLTNPPRAVVAIEGVHRNLDPSELPIGDRYVTRARLVHHADQTPPELLVVLDLSEPGPEIIDLRVEGDRVEITVGPPPDTVDAAPTPTPSPSPLVPTPTRTPVPTETPEPTSTFEPTPTPTPTPTATSTPVFTDSPAPVPSDTPPPSPRPTSAPSSSSTPDGVVLPPPEPTPTPVPVAASRIEEITLSNRKDGSTLLLLTADGRLPRGCARHMKMSGAEPRIVVSLRGITAPDLPRTRSFEDANISRIRVVHDVETLQSELHLLISTTGNAVEVRRMEIAGPNLVLLLDGGDPQ